MIIARILITLIGFGVSTTVCSLAIDHRDSRGHPVPPEPSFLGAFDDDYNPEEIANRLKAWTPEDEQNAWELSGLYEGDIMLLPNSSLSKNGLLNDTTRWPDGVVPYYIREDLDEEGVSAIMAALDEYHEKTCLRFRPYNESDKDYVILQSSSSGCWSMVGRQGEGQIVNLHSPGCLHRGVIIHEIMHALGFYHQQSASDRDEWVTIQWGNIKPGLEYNFNKYDECTVTDYGIEYDYDSIMHYSERAFSKNGEPTIVPTKDDVKIGQRNYLSEKDLAKIQEMYKEECGKRGPEEDNGGGGGGGDDDDDDDDDDDNINGPLDWLID